MSHTVEIVAIIIFAIAILHTFTAGFVGKLADKFPRHKGLFHLLSEVEVVFGFWALVLLLFIIIISGLDSSISYLESRNFTEPLFVFVIMVLCGSLVVASAAP